MHNPGKVLDEMLVPRRNHFKYGLDIIPEINKILSRKWMGSPKKRDSPLYNLNKNYGYNVDSRSGFYKKWWEKIRDSIIENTVQ